MNIRIGDKNKIKNSSIGNTTTNINNDDGTKKKNFFERHPLLSSFIIGFILLFPIWKNIAEWISENIRELF